MRFTDSIWERIRSNDTSKIPTFVSETASELPEQPEFDVTVCGGTLGIFLATSLQLKGLKVCVVERGPLAGRAQEWNISRSELKALVSLGVLTDEEIEQAIAVEFNPVRMQFKARSSHQNPTTFTSTACAQNCRLPLAVHSSHISYPYGSYLILEYGTC